MTASSIVSVVLLVMVVYFPFLLYKCWSQKREIETARNELLHVINREYTISRDEAVKAFEEVLNNRESGFYEIVRDVVSNQVKLGRSHNYMYYTNAQDSSNAYADGQGLHG